MLQIKKSDIIKGDLVEFGTFCLLKANFFFSLLKHIAERNSSINTEFCVSAKSALSAVIVKDQNTM